MRRSAFSRGRLAAIALGAALLSIGLWFVATPARVHAHSHQAPAATASILLPLLAIAATLLAGLAAIAARTPERRLLPPTTPRGVAGIAATRNRHPHVQDATPAARVEALIQRAERQALLLRKSALSRERARLLVELRQIESQLDPASPAMAMDMPGERGALRHDATLPAPPTTPNALRVRQRHILHPRARRSHTPLFPRLPQLDQAVWLARWLSALARLRVYLTQHYVTRLLTGMRAAATFIHAGAYFAGETTVRTERRLSRWLVGTWPTDPSAKPSVPYTPMPAPSPRASSPSDPPVPQSSSRPSTKATCASTVPAHPSSPPRAQTGTAPSSSSNRHSSTPRLTPVPSSVTTPVAVVATSATDD